jgi:GNAT superfamily N-acetyltransferase/predicted enzyme related to lactoylglutathione lyase
MEVRPFEPGDEPAVVALWNACELTRPWNDPHRDIARKLRVAPELFLVGRVDERLVASVMVGYEGHRGWLNYLAVDPAFRRQGLGRALVAVAEERLRALGCPKVNLQVRAGHDDVIDFYRRMGYAADDVVCLGKRLEPDGPPPAPAGKADGGPSRPPAQSLSAGPGSPSPGERTMSAPIESLGAVTVHVNDVKRSRPFYKDALGLTEIEYNEEFQRARYAIPGTSTLLTIHRQGEGEGGRAPGTVSGIVFFHHDPFAAIAEIKRRGGTITNEPVTVERPGVVAYTLGVVADPDGNEFVIRAPPAPPK